MPIKIEITANDPSEYRALLSALGISGAKTYAEEVIEAYEAEELEDEDSPTTVGANGYTADRWRNASRDEAGDAEERPKRKRRTKAEMHALRTKGEVKAEVEAMPDQDLVAAVIPPKLQDRAIDLIAERSTEAVVADQAEKAKIYDKLSIVDVRNAIRRLSEADGHGFDAAQSVLKKYCGDKPPRASDVPEARYGEFVAEVEQMLSA